VDKDKGNTKTTELAGTAYFLSPEQAMGRAIDTRADLYSVGASMFYVLTGKYPFTGKNSMDIIQKHINEPVPDVAQYRRGLPPWIPAAINKLMSKNPDDRFQTATQTLMYFQKMRADDQLKVTSSGVNIADEVGLKISNVEMGGPAAPKTADISDAHTTQSNRFNMNIAPRTDRANRSSIPIMSLGSAAPKDIPNHRQTAEPRPQLRPEKVVTDNVPPPNKRKFAASRHTGEGFFKRHQHLVKSFFTMALALLMMLGANFLLFKLGVLCSQYDIAGKSFFNALITPWVSGDFLPGQTPLGAVCFIFLAFTATMYFFGSISKIVPVTLVIAALAYLGGFFGWEKPFPDGGFSAFTYLPMYAFIFGALGINIDENDSFHFVYRFSCLVFFALAFYCIYLFTAPQEFVKGELTASLFYSTIGLTAAALVLPFIRGGRIFRLAAVLLFVSCCASIWVYQTSGNVYKLMQEINLSAARAEQQAPAPAPPQEEEPQAKYTLEIQNFSYTQGFYADPRREAAFAAENLRPEQIKEESAPQQEQPAVEAPLLTPGQKRALFISNINASAAQLTPAQAQRLVWVFALQEPVEKFKHDYKREGFARFTIIALTIYGALMFIIFLLGSREERWNLI
jgi:hypothetical protein